MKGGEEERWGGEERSVSVECRVVVLLTFLGPSSGGFVYSRVEIGEEEIFLAPIVLISSSRTQVVVDRSICIHGGWRWIHLCGGGGEEKRKRGTRGGDWKRGEEEIRGGGEGRRGEGRRRGGGEEMSRG